MELPIVQRFGDTWTMVWESLRVGMGFENLDRSRDGLVAEVVVESRHPESVQHRLLGPVRLNLLSMQSQTQFANTLHKRLDAAPWTDMVVMACALVVTEYGEPSPTVSLDEVDLGAERIEYLLPGLLPLGETTFCYGDSESLKSMLASLIAVCVVHNHPLPWGALPTRSCKVLYCDWETNHVVLAERVQRLARGLGLEERPRIAYRGTLRGRDVSPLRALPEEVASLRAQVQREKIGLVIVDSIGFAVDGKLVDDDVARKAMTALRQLTPATRLVVAHISKEGSRTNGRVDPFGSIFFRHGIRSGFEVRRADQDSADDVDIGVYHWKGNDDSHLKAFGLRAHFTPNRGPITFVHRPLDAHPELAMHTPLATRLREALRDGSSPIFELAEALDADPKVVDMTLRRMPDAIRLDSGGRGVPANWGLRQ